MSRETVESISVDVGAAPSTRRARAWADAICDNFYPLDLLDPAEAFEVGRLKAIALPGVRLGAIESDSYRVHRRGKHIAAGGGDYYFLPIPQTHALGLRQSARDTILKPGAFSVVSTCEPYQYLQTTRNRLMTVRVDGRLMRERIPMIDDMLAESRDADLPMVAVFASFVSSLLLEGDRLDVATAHAISPKLLDLLALALSSPEAGAQSSESSVRLAYLRRINLKIEGRLSNPDFRPATLASEIGISERYMQRILAESGHTASALIKSRRIATAQQRLSDPVRAGQSISAIAYSVGFADVAHFSRSFRALVGVSPREFRRSTADPAS